MLLNIEVNILNLVGPLQQAKYNDIIFLYFYIMYTVYSQEKNTPRGYT